ncbi:IS3 family transposase [Streptomyces sioyaensis]|uniref:IS3 family transposase n=1 Tax=Streptomyces sioyaensis TaxID=67364 RepID=UPI00379A6D64
MEALQFELREAEVVWKRFVIARETVALLLAGPREDQEVPPVVAPGELPVLGAAAVPGSVVPWRERARPDGAGAGLLADHGDPGGRSGADAGGESLRVDPVCRVLELSPSTYFARKKRPKSARRLRDEQLMPLIEEIHAESGGTYGARRITRALRRKGVDVARCTVERPMAELSPGGRHPRAAAADHRPEPAVPRPPDLVDRDFTAERPDQLWVADMTYVRTWSGWAYVAFVLDVYSRMIVGWQVTNHMRTELPLDAVKMALWRSVGRTKRMITPLAGPVAG